jgi:hypothetical protein
MVSAVAITMSAVVISNHLSSVKVDAIAMIIVTRTIAITTKTILDIALDSLECLYSSNVYVS